LDRRFLCKPPVAHIAQRPPDLQIGDRCEHAFPHARAILASEMHLVKSVNLIDRDHLCIRPVAKPILNFSLFHLVPPSFVVAVM
jgi:hypothetical protein